MRPATDYNKVAVELVAARIERCITGEGLRHLENAQFAGRIIEVTEDRVIGPLINKDIRGDANVLNRNKMMRADCRTEKRSKLSFVLPSAAGERSRWSSGICSWVGRIKQRDRLHRRTDGAQHDSNCDYENLAKSAHFSPR